MIKFLRAGQKVEVSNFISCFCLKDNLPEQNVDRASSYPDSKDLQKVSSKFSYTMVSKSVKIYGKFVLGLRLFCPVTMHSLSQHECYCYLFQYKGSNSLSRHTLCYTALHTILMLHVPCFPYLFFTHLLHQFSYQLHSYIQQKKK